MTHPTLSDEKEDGSMPSAMSAPRRIRAQSREGMVVTTIALPEALLDALHDRAREKRMAMTALVREIIEDGLRRPGRRARPGAAR